jgi:hypothetical protein
VTYFDHVRCHGCKAMLDPDTLGPGRCPKCGVTLSLQDLFGLSAALSEEDEEGVTLDDLVAAPRAPAEPGSALEAMRALKKSG